MREIKFRGKAEEEIDEVCRAGEFIYGSFIADKYRPYIVGQIVEADEDGISPEFWIPVIGETVGQFTGLLDRDGKEIYEGDMVLATASDRAKTQYYGAVVWARHGFTLSPNRTKFIDNAVLLLCKQWQVVGNIHEHPDLLTK